MDDSRLLQLLLGIHAVVGLLTAGLLLRVSAPYGRHAREGWGPQVPFAIGWAAMEGLSPVLMTALFVMGDRQDNGFAWLVLALWWLHYGHRAFVQAWQRRDRGTPIPLSVVAMALLFNAVNACTNGWYLFDVGPVRGAAWLADPRFGIGLALFLVGMGVNRWADRVLLSLRSPGESGYKVPHGGLYRWISCPNYLGEIVEWIGFAVMTWSPPGVVFALWTAANLVPRALSHHAWYRGTFDDYPPSRRALLPGLL